MLDVTTMSYPSQCSMVWVPRRFKTLVIQVDHETRRRLTLIVKNYHKTVNCVNKKSLSCFKSNSEIECYCAKFEPTVTILLDMSHIDGNLVLFIRDFISPSVIN